MKSLRFVTAASLFDGHDVSINIMRRLLQANGAEVIHLGHNRSAQEVVDAALQEDANAVALSSYQGGHNEYFAYIRELLDEAGATHVKIFGGGGGVITPSEIKALHEKGITKIYSPEDGMKLGLQGIIKDMIDRASFSTIENVEFINLKSKSLPKSDIARVITYIEDNGDLPFEVDQKSTPVLGITGTGGAGKSSLIDEVLLRFHRSYKDKKIALVSVDPTKKKTQGALLGDRIRLGSAVYENFYIRSLATRDSKSELSPQIKKVVSFLKSQDFDLIIVETSGIGQASDEITKVADKCIYVMTPEYGAASQLEKIEMLEQADFIVLNKFEKPRSEDALRDIRKQYRRNTGLFAGHPGSPTDEELPVFGTMASQFNDAGVNALFFELAKTFDFDVKDLEELKKERVPSNKTKIIPPERSLYLREISSACRKYNEAAERNAELVKDYEALQNVALMMPENKDVLAKLEEVKEKIPSDVFKEIEVFESAVEQYRSGIFTYKVRDKEINVKTKYTSLSHNEISKVGFPNLNSTYEKYRYIKKTNLPGHFPYAAGIFPFKRADEDPKRMFAGEGGPTRTNKRFHYLSENDPAKRLSTAFDSVTLYGEDPDLRPDIFGKIGEAGVSIATLDDMQELFKGFKLTDPMTSVSMTINGPAPIILAMFMNTAMKQDLEGDDFWDEEKRANVMRMVRGTVQADILKEDQAQNTCIFSLEFALKLMGDVQAYFCKNLIKNYYTVSVSGYHIAEAGANPISQVAFTLANGFTFVEYYLSRGMNIDEFSGNLSFFFSNGLDPEYTVIGRVARKIWAVAMRDKYGASKKSQMFKYHVQTSGRSLHAQEIDFNDIRTTLQAFLALSDNCNSLHTNAYDEAITTPTEESVRRAMAIQMIINREFGLNKTDNPLQGSYIYEELSEIVEEAILAEFERISDKGGVLGAMESMYQRGKIQDESLYYETLKDNGELPIIGVNTYIADNIDEQLNQEIELSRCSDEEKKDQINRLEEFKKRNSKESKEALETLKEVALSGGNIFEELLKTVNYCSLGEITGVLYEIGGRYRRNM
ncbi:methylmalonyl-CoA mutase family protein [Halobacteriovorax sp. GB3]|uniref:fused isobutyryl-CoA mutase/GTPase IcmF n=1 Tax=Halobacteriovorax sp. GB3 TaxID=2719615 RepID=UPI002362898A|nr:fused isobutyryl-CoA mutase/GTPase IcmF [Halobacteriovorax sp. GB3]MDD0854800.1 methylmalonyl-CoA mutase family protein [Halobacteriovorax sp. GB3]